MTIYRGNCHCGRFVFEVTLPEPITTGFSCNCSICAKKGYVFADFPDESTFTVVKGSLDDLTSYSIGEVYDHKFCPTCGSGVLLNPRQPGTGVKEAVNIRCIQELLDLWAMKKSVFDGKKMGQPYIEPDFTGPDPPDDPAALGPTKVYHGSCHCGAVRLAVRFKDMTTLEPDDETHRVVDCNCSVCTRGGYLWIYPDQAQVAIEDDGGGGGDHLVYYVFNHHVNRKGFCRTCGVHLVNASNPLTPAQLARLPPLAQSPIACERREALLKRCSVNARVLHGVDVDKLPIRQVDGRNFIQPFYVNP